MYNLLITSQAGTWDGNAYEYERDRCVNEHEYTDSEIVQQYGSLSRKDIAALMSFPCLFAYEDQIKMNGFLGWLTNIRPRANAVRIEFEIERNLPPITPDTLRNLTFELDSHDWELNRTHWAVKDVDLLPALIAAGVLTENQIRARGQDSKLVQLGLTRPVTELRIQPTVFRVPSSPVEDDLVSVMMPFEMAFDRVYETIGTACTQVTLRCQRADDIWDEAEVIQDVFSLIYRSRVVICDFSGRNSNVFYEAGIAHTLGKSVIPIVQSEGDIPFDLRHIRFIKYLDNGEGRAALQEAVAGKLTLLTGAGP